MYCQKIVGLLTFAAVLSTDHALALQKKPQYKPKATTEQLLLSGVDSSQKTEEELNTLVKGFHALLKQEKPGLKRDSFLIAEASAFLALARIYRTNPQRTEKQKKMEDVYLKLAHRNAESVAQSSFADKVARSKAKYYAGLALIYIGNTNKAQQNFIEAMSLNEKSEFSPGMSLFVAETYFDQEKYKDAIKYYRMYYTKLNDGQKALAVYKIAWSYFNQQNLDMAEKNFLFIVGKKWAGSFAQDSLKDLAFVVTRHISNDNGLIEFAEKNFQQMPAIYIEFLTTVYTTLQAQSSTTRRPVLFAEIMSKEKDPKKRLQLLISNLKAQQRSYASVEPYKDFVVINDHVTENAMSPESDVIKAVSVELENEVQSITRSYAETLSGRTKTPENLTKADISTKLLVLLNFHAKYFPKSEGKQTTYDIWLGVCAEMKDYVCSYDISHKIIEDESLKKLSEKAHIELFKALDALKTKDQKYRGEYIATLTKYVVENENIKQWLPLAKQLTALQNEDKKFNESIPLLEKIYSKEKSSEAFFRLQWARFESQDFEAVVNQKDGPNTVDKFAQETKMLVREAHLRLAQDKIKKEDFSSYEGHIKGFLASSPSESKADEALNDYLGRLLDRNDKEKVFQVLMPMASSKRFSSTFKSVTARLVDKYIQEAEFKRAYEVLHTNIKPGELVKDFEIDQYVCKLGMQAPFSKEDLHVLSKTSAPVKNYILSLLVVTQPKAIISYFTVNPPVTLVDRKLLLLAHQLQGGKANVTLNAATLKILGNAVPAELLIVPPTAFEKEADKNIKSLKKVSVLAEVTRALRKRVIKDLEGKVPVVQMRILDKAIELEEKTAQKIISAPRPTQLSADQQKEYDAGIQELSKEFTNQASEFLKIKKAIQDKLNTHAKEMGTAQVIINKWALPSGAVKDTIRSLLEKNNGTGALIVLERWKNLAAISPEEYHSMRAYILLFVNRSEFMTEYVYSELVSAKQDKLIEQWRNINQ